MQLSLEVEEKSWEDAVSKPSSSSCKRLHAQLHCRIISVEKSWGEGTGRGDGEFGAGALEQSCTKRGGCTHQCWTPHRSLSSAMSEYKLRRFSNIQNSTRVILCLLKQIINVRFHFVCLHLKPFKFSVNSFLLHFIKVTVFDRFEIWLFSRDRLRSTAQKPGRAIQRLELWTAPSEVGHA